MTTRDVEPASAAILADDWGDRLAWFRFAVDHPACDVLVAETDGDVVGTAVTTHSGAAAWIGTIWVAPTARGQGLGRRLTEAAIDSAVAAGHPTLVLVATEVGRPLYQRLGFEVRSWYHTMEAPGRLGSFGGTTRVRAPDHAATVRPFRPTDLATLAVLDAGATGEDRSHLLVAFASPESTRVVTGPDDVPRGFMLRAPWGGGATVAADPDDAMALLDARRDAYPAQRRVRAGVLAQNEAGRARLEADGWTEAWRAPRLERGSPLLWQPNAIWGQFNHALG